MALLRAMARRDDGEAALAEIKAVDETYPLAGEAVLAPALPLADALAERDGAYGIVADAALLGKLGLAIGNRLAIGGARFELRAVLVSEPDRLASGIRFGAPALISQAALRASANIMNRLAVPFSTHRIFRHMRSYSSSDRAAGFIGTGTRGEELL